MKLTDKNVLKMIAYKKELLPSFREILEFPDVNEVAIVILERLGYL